MTFPMVTPRGFQMNAVIRGTKYRGLGNVTTGPNLPGEGPYDPTNIFLYGPDSVPMESGALNLEAFKMESQTLNQTLGPYEQFGFYGGKIVTWLNNNTSTVLFGLAGIYLLTAMGMGGRRGR